MTRIPSNIQPTGNTSYLVPPTVLKAEGLVKIYGKRRVVDGVSLHVNKGEVVGLIGPNGAGKTTSFRMTCGLIDANEGIVYLNGKDVTGWPLYRRVREGGMGYLPQMGSVFQQLSVQDNLLGMMEMLGMDRRTRREKCDELLEKMKLTDLRKNLAKGLSGGERRRLEIARALVSDPKIILLDEPFVAIDPITVQRLQKIIRKLVDDGITILITDHDVVETFEITDRIYVIEAGKVLCTGTPKEVLANERAREAYFGDLATRQQGQPQGPQKTLPELSSDRKPKPRHNDDLNEFGDDELGHMPRRASRPVRPAMPDLNDYGPKASAKKDDFDTDFDADFDDSFEDYKPSRHRPTVKVRSPRADVSPRAGLLGADQPAKPSSRPDSAPGVHEPHNRDLERRQTERQSDPPHDVRTPKYSSSQRDTSETSGGVRRRSRPDGSPPNGSERNPQTPLGGDPGKKLPRASLLGRLSGVFKKPTENDKQD